MKKYILTFSALLLSSSMASLAFAATSTQSKSAPKTFSIKAQPTGQPEFSPELSPQLQRWAGQGTWASSIENQWATGPFAMNLMVTEDLSRPNLGRVTGTVSTPYGNFVLKTGYFKPDSLRLSLVYDVVTRAGVALELMLRGHISADKHLYSAEVFAFISSTEDLVASDELTQALRSEFQVPIDVARNKLIRSVGSVNAFAR